MYFIKKKDKMEPFLMFLKILKHRVNNQEIEFISFQTLHTIKTNEDERYENLTKCVYFSKNKIRKKN